MLQLVRRMLGPIDAGERVTHGEFSSADFDAPFSYERVRGRLVVRPPLDGRDRCFSRPFRRELPWYWGRHPSLVDDVDIRGWVATSDDDDRLPDICVYLVSSRSNRVVPYQVPDIIFEFVSGSCADQERDYVYKRAEFHAIGVREYVIVDRFKETALVLTWQPDDYAERVLRTADVYTTPLLPGLEIRLGEVFPAEEM